MNSTQTSQFGAEFSSESSLLQELTRDQKLRLSEILDLHLRVLESGMPADGDRLLREHPDLAGPLRVYLDSLHQMHEATAGLGEPNQVADVQDCDFSELEQRLGDFAIVREIGRGGMGVVYEACQLSLGRRVALKVLPFGAVLDPRRIARFQNEAHAAAGLNHPNIVPVHAIGSERGVHYYAMQLIDGQPLDLAVRDLHATSTDTAYFRRVVELGIQAADALHAAHRGGIVHRDIKPSNLLVDGDGKLWITDFGLALCQRDSSLTHSGDIVGTQRYMSPEQAAGKSSLVDQRTDVYSLGITLHELLTLPPAVVDEADDATPARNNDSQTAPRRSLQSRLPRDLETVVLKATAADKDDRYSTARQFADDLRCVLEGKPTMARPPSIPDRLVKWVRRHSQAATAIVAVGLLAMLGLGAATLLVNRQKVRADQNFARAERNFRQAEGTVDRFGAQLAERLANVAGAEHVRRDLLQETLTYYQQFVAQAGDDPALRADLAMTYSKIGTVADEMGSATDAIAAHERAGRLYQQLAAENSGRVEYRRLAGICWNNYARSLSRGGRAKEAQVAYDAAIRWQTQLVDDFPDAEQFACDLSLSHNNLGLFLSETGKSREAKECFYQAIRLCENRVRSTPLNADLLQALASSHNNLAAVHRDDDPTSAIDCYQAATAYLRRAIAVDRDNQKYQADLAVSLCNLGSVQSRSHRLDDAAASYREAIARQQELLRAFPQMRSSRRDLAISHNNLGLLQTKLRSYSEAEASFRASVTAQEQLLSDVSNDFQVQSSTGGAFNNLGIVLEELRRLPEAAESYQRAVKHQLVAYSQASGVERYRSFLSKHYFNYGRVLRHLDKPDQAVRVALARKALWPRDSKRLYSVAEELGLASRMLARKTSPEMSGAQCQDLAIATLQEALSAGLKLPADLDRHKAFAALAQHPGFQRLVNQQAPEGAAMKTARKQSLGKTGKDTGRKSRRLMIEVLGDRLVLSAAAPHHFDAPPPRHSELDHDHFVSRGDRGDSRANDAARPVRFDNQLRGFSDLQHHGDPGRSDGDRRLSNRRREDFGDSGLAQQSTMVNQGPDLRRVSSPDSRLITGGPSTTNPAVAVRADDVRPFNSALRASAQTAPVSLPAEMAVRVPPRPTALPSFADESTNVKRSGVDSSNMAVAHFAAFRGLSTVTLNEYASRVDAAFAELRYLNDPTRDSPLLADEGGLVESETVGSKTSDAIESNQDGDVKSRRDESIAELLNEAVNRTRRDRRTKLKHDADLDVDQSRRVRVKIATADLVTESDEGGLIELALSTSSATVSPALEVAPDGLADFDIPMDAHAALFQELDVADSVRDQEDTTEFTVEADAGELPPTLGTETSSSSDNNANALIAGAGVLICVTGWNRRGNESTWSIAQAVAGSIWRSLRTGTFRSIPSRSFPSSAWKRARSKLCFTLVR